MKQIGQSRTAQMGVAVVAILGAAWFLTSIDPVEAKGGPPGGKNVNVVDSVELDVNVVDSTELDVNVVGSVEQDVRITGSALTHMGRSVEDHVTLILEFVTGPNGCPGLASFSDRILVRVYPDGTKDADEFVVPDGRTLVVTDVEWRSSGRRVGGSPLVAGRTLTFVLFAAGHRAATIDQTIDTVDGSPGANLHLTSGVLAGPGTNICSSVSMRNSSSFSAVEMLEMMVQGYLIDSF